MPPETADRCADELAASLSPMLLPEVRTGILALRFRLQQLAQDPLYDPKDIARDVVALLHAARRNNADAHIRRANVTVVIAEAKRAIAHMCPTSWSARAIEHRIGES